MNTAFTSDHLSLDSTWLQPWHPIAFPHGFVPIFLDDVSSLLRIVNCHPEYSLFWRLIRRPLLYIFGRCKIRKRPY